MVQTGKRQRAIKVKKENEEREKVELIKWNSFISLKHGPAGADAIKKFTPSLGIPYLGV